jgi:hypothetical protein
MVARRGERRGFKRGLWTDRRRELSFGSRSGTVGNSSDARIDDPNRNLIDLFGREPRGVHRAGLIDRNMDGYNAIIFSRE